MANAKYGKLLMDGDDDENEVTSVYVDDTQATIITLDGDVIWLNTNNCYSKELDSYLNGNSPIVTNKGLQSFDVDLKAFVNGTNNSGDYQYHANFGAGSVGDTNYDNIEFYVRIVIKQDASGTHEIGYSIYMQLIGWKSGTATSLWEDSYTNISGNSFSGEVSYIRLIPRCSIYASDDRNKLALYVGLQRRLSDGKLISIDLKDYPAINMYNAVQNMADGYGDGRVYVFSVGSSNDYGSVLTKYDKDGNVVNQGENTVTLKSFIPF